MNCRKVFMVTISKLLLTVALLAAFLSVASAQKMDFDISPGTDFSKFKTYKWQRAKDTTYPSDEVDRLFVRAIDEQLRLKGLALTDSDDADLYVIYQLAIVDDMKWSSFTTDIGWHGNPVSGISSIPGATTNSSYPVSIGSLFIDLYDVSKKSRVWQVHATKTVEPDNSMEKKEKNIRKVLTKIFKYYPPR